ncbi:T9SS type A sorting domain-containing protein [Rhodohalobacter sp. 8-1]|uniref:T9SS type A sorting domain-containing protein n=1 Tax=Rhodohalobacter sp. 8-1 TaxID=3131972 RepID=UPI0030EDC4B6
MKKALLLLLTIALMPILANAQWNPEGNFPEGDTLGGNHGIAVDAEGKIWVHDFYATGFLRSDSTQNVVDVRVFNPDGTEVEWSPVQQATVGETSHIFVQGRGMRTGPNGDILYADGSTLILLDHTNGEAISIVLPETGSSLTAPATDGAGNVYIAGVVGGDIIKYDPTLSTREVVVEGVPAIGRTMEVSEDGNTIYVPRFTANTMYVYSRANDLVPYPTDPDSVLQNSDIESIVRHPSNGQIWVSAANYLRPAEDVLANYTPNVWYGYNSETWAREDSVEWDFHGEDPFGPDPEYLPSDQVPRAVEFNNDGSAIYIGAFRNSGPGFPAVQYFTGMATSVDAPREQPEGYTLDQNYPNPFNPSTTIEFTLGQGGATTLKVYDISGREVASILSGRQLNAGSHSYTFDASSLSSGIYFYRLNSSGVQITRKMTLVK